VQLLQLAHGPADPSLRVPSTLGGLRALARAGRFASPADAQALEAAYLFLRRVECRLQLVHAWDESTVDPDPASFGRLARLLGDRRAAEGGSADDLAEELRCHRHQVRNIYQQTVQQLVGRDSSPDAAQGG